MTNREDGAVRAEALRTEALRAETLRAESEPDMDPVPAGDDPAAEVPSRDGCRTRLRGWAGAHLHGAVRPRRRAVGRGRPPGRWC